MRRKTSLPELLAPAGDMRALIAAVEAGADAVYVGGKAFGARAYAKNFDIDELSHAVEYCHLFGVKLYVTVNTLVFDREMEELSDYAVKLWEIGVDALIVADLGAIAEIRRRVPELELHASTQMSVHNTEGAQVAYSLGCSRVVPARELSIENIRSIVDGCECEVEVFLHGALCVSHSGQCLMSSLVGGRSGNRGECAQPCRLPYSGSYPLSLKDLSLAEHIPELIESGVASLKIEGRMKSAEYVYTVTGIYRRLLDEGRAASGKEREALARAFSRGGFTDGYLTSRLGREMLGVRSDKDKEISREMAALDTEPRRVAVRAEARLILGEPASLTLILGDRRVTVKGDAPSRALNSPLTEESVKARLMKMGGTSLLLSESDIVLTLDEGINLPPSSINYLRREAVSRLVSCARSLENIGTPCQIKREKEKNNVNKSALFFNIDEYIKIKDSLPVELDKIFIPLMKIDEGLYGANGVYLPPVILDSEFCEVEAALMRARELGAIYALVGNIGAIALARRCGLIPVGDFRLNVTNSLSYREYLSLGLSEIILSPELTLPMARDVGGTVITLGRIPLMLTERCFISDTAGCDRCESASLTDRTGAKFPMMREYKHRNIIFNSTVTYMGDRREELSRAGLTSEHFIFSSESASEIKAILTAYKRGVLPSCAVRRMGKRETPQKAKK